MQVLDRRAVAFVAGKLRSQQTGAFSGEAKAVKVGFLKAGKAPFLRRGETETLKRARRFGCGIAQRNALPVHGPLHHAGLAVN